MITTATAAREKRTARNVVKKNENEYIKLYQVRVWYET